MNDAADQAGAPTAQQSAQDMINTYWTHRAHAYHENQTVSARAPYDVALWTREFGRHLPPSPQRVIDVGCGPGFVSHICASLGHDVTGIDASTGMLEEARAEADQHAAEGRPCPSFMRGNAMSVSLGDAVADVVTSRYLLWTLLNPVQALRDWLRILRPGGLLICADANHFPEGIGAELKVDSEGGPDEFTRVYNPFLQHQLPLALEQSTDAYVQAFEEAGAVDIQVHTVDGVKEIDERCGLPAGHQHVHYYMIIARKPG